MGECRVDVQMPNPDLARRSVPWKYTVRRIREPRVTALDLDIEGAIAVQGQRRRTYERNRRFGQRLGERGPRAWSRDTKARPVPHHSLGDTWQESVRVDHQHHRSAASRPTPRVFCSGPTLEPVPNSDDKS